MGVHDGHRARVRQRVLQEGLAHLDAHNVLEVLLFFAMPRGDTNELAHRILAHYHNDFAAVLEAPYEDLRTIEGVGENTAFLLKMLPQFAAYYRRARIRGGLALDSMDNLTEYFVPMFYGKREEEVHLLCLDAALHPLQDTVVSEGTVNASALSVRRIVETAVQNHASRVILAHNHPGGNPRPSMRDETVTRTIVAALKLVDIELLDHVIVADESICSMRNSHILPYSEL